ncbi:MAG: histidine phosphatase family protein [Cognatishimia sp.]|uniref:histidine phosphatase family protein n=1 Tax=Cognatishimia sp. TaxID=2211648 RepID=UPI003B8E16F7
MSRLFLVRHGPTHAKTMVGWSDLPADLSDIAALERLENFLPSDAIMVSSDLSRAVETGNAVQGDRHRLPHMPALRELHFGSWELKSHAEVEDQDLMRAYWEQPGDIKAPEGESWNDLIKRVNQAIDTLIVNAMGEDLIVVCHFGVIITQVQRALGLSAYDAFSHHINNLSVTEIRTTPNWSAPLINHNP